MTASPPMSLRDLVRAVAGDFRRCFAVLVAFEALFKLLAALVVVPVIAAGLFHLLRAQGRTAVTNDDILGFLLSPVGVLYGFVFGLKLLGIALLEHAGVMALAALKQTGRWQGMRHAFVVLAVRSLRVLRLAAVVLGVAVVVLAPFAGLAALAYALLLSDQDINYYLAVRPPRFYLACGIGAGLLLAALALAASLYVRWAFALPIVLLEDRQPLAALRASAARVRGAFVRVGAVLLAWQAVAFFGQAAALALFKVAAALVLAAAGSRPATVVPVVVSLLVGQGLLLAVLSSLATVVHCLLILRLYAARSVASGVLPEGDWTASLDAHPAAPGRWLARLEWGAAAVVLAAALTYLVLTLPFTLAERVQVTAHRGYSRVAPQNTLSAIRAAIDVGADWAEIDVQQTRDGEVILLHDSDLKLMTGDGRRPDQLTLSELRTLPARERFGPEFSSERIPTLREVIALARGRIKVNIELKFYGEDRKKHRLAKKVADLLREEQFEDECFVASLDYDGVMLARKHNPRLRTAHIVTVALGDVSKLEVDVLSVRADLADDRLLREARRLDKEVHVWTINDRRAMRRWIERGVNNVITDDPETFIAERAEREDLGDVQRLLLACRDLLR
jgi:glycerophosphoryl diester phosphodiesterase